MTLKEIIRIELNDIVFGIEFTLNIGGDSLEWDLDQISVGFYECFPSVSAIPSSILCDEDKTYLETLIEREISKNDWQGDALSNSQEYCPDCERN